MRIDTQARQQIKAGNMNTLRELITKEAEELTKTLKSSIDILSIRFTQGQLSVLDKLKSALT